MIPHHLPWKLMVLKKVQIPSNYSTDLLSDMLVLPRPADDGPTCKRKQKSVNLQGSMYYRWWGSGATQGKSSREGWSWEREEQRRKEKQLLAERRKKEQAEKQLKKRKKRKRRKLSFNNWTRELFFMLSICWPAPHSVNLHEEEESRKEDTCCPKCGLIYADSDGVLWACCDSFELWYDLKCTAIRKKTIPDLVYCNKCVKKHWPIIRTPTHNYLFYTSFLFFSFLFQL